jgi:hypothetical protein
MATLRDALRASDLETAYADAGLDTRVTVERHEASRQPEESQRREGNVRYVIREQRGPALPRQVAEVGSLDDVKDQLHALDIPGFDLDSAVWEPAMAATEHNNAVWSDEAPARGTPPSPNESGLPPLDAEPTPDYGDWDERGDVPVW